MDLVNEELDELNEEKEKHEENKNKNFERKLIEKQKENEIYENSIQDIKNIKE